MTQRCYHLLVALVFYIPFQISYRLFCMTCGLLYFLLFCLRRSISTCLRTRYSKNALPTLITIRFSHYCEKARWVLDILRHAANETGNGSYDYVERPHSILTHMKSSFWHTNGFSSSTPIYITKDKNVLKDSSDIMHYVSDELCKLGKPTLYPMPEVEELEVYFNTVFGVHVRRYVYWLLFQSDDMESELRNCWLRETSGLENWIQRHAFGSIKALATVGMNIKEEPSMNSKHIVDTVFDKVNRMLEENNGSYILNTTHPTAADFTFAALAYPMVSPPQCDELVFGYDPKIMSHSMYEQITIYREQAAGKFVLRMYEKERLVKKIQPKND